MLILLTSNALSGMWETIQNIKTVIGLTAFALAVVLSVMLAWFKSKRRRIPAAFWVVVIALTLIGVGATTYNTRDELYRVRVTVLGLEQIPIEDAKVWSSFGGEPKKVAGGWQFDIPTANKPQDSKLTFFASKESAFLTGKTELTLSNDYNPTVTVSLVRVETKIRGQLVDRKNRAVAGALVFVVGYQAEAAITKEDGNFELPAHAAIGQQVLLHAEKDSLSASGWYSAGDFPAVLMIER